MERKTQYKEEYWTWVSMKQRCYNDRKGDYKHYGGRGIKVCERWRNDFVAFLTDMGPRPSAKHSIERIDNDGNYEPGNCRWATQQEQVNNCRSNRRLTAFGKTQTITQWASEYGVLFGLINDRLRLGWAVEDAISTPSGGKYKLIAAFGRKQTQAQWCREFGISKDTFKHRLKIGWTVEDALTRKPQSTGRGT